ncbi:MAG: bifunctional demethylmenaquinone methyltransferase/2-methoxy-6-polyprenyl-1,4-benzoquinol methylase UbiE [Phycisphaeraceae bacterium]
MPSTPAWTDEDLTKNPHAAADKARRVREMFASIAPSYDLNNRVHSLGRDQSWRRKAVKLAEVKDSDVVLDVACGTGDLSLAFTKAGAARVIGVDFTHEMLVVAETKGPRAKGQGPGESETQDTGHRTQDTGPTYATGDAMRLPLPDACVDIVSIAFGIRNVTDPAKAVGEFLRVLRPGGRLIILEFSLPRNFLLRGMYNFYFKHIMPRTATWISRDKSGAYKYLPRSVNTFINRETMITMMNDAGFGEVMHKTLTFGIAVIYRGVKR